MIHTVVTLVTVLFGFGAVVWPVLVVVLICATVDSDHSRGYKIEKIFRLLSSGFYGTAALAAISACYWLINHQPFNVSSDTVFKVVLGLGAAEMAALVCWFAGYAASWFRDISDRDPFLNLTRVLSFQ